MLACQIQRCNKFRLDNLLAMQYAMLLLSRGMEGGRKGEERYKYKLSCYVITDIVHNEVYGEGENEGVGLPVPNECTYRCSGLLKESSKLATFIN